MYGGMNRGLPYSISVTANELHTILSVTAPTHPLLQDFTLGTGKMAQRVKASATKPDGQSLSPRTGMVGGEN